VSSGSPLGRATGRFGERRRGLGGADVGEGAEGDATGERRQEVSRWGQLDHGLTPETAVDLLLTFCGDGVYVELRINRGWSHDQVMDWLVATLPLLLLADGART
jgi:hypothetical protein